MQNCLRLLLIICCTALVFSSCQKELSNESGVAQVATGTLKDSTGNCLPDSVAGTFYDGITPGGDTAYVEIQVNVAKTGSYSIITDLQNGFEFADSGIFTTTGLNIIRLRPVGTPILPKSTLFTIGFDSSFCTFSVDVQDSTGTGIHSGGGGIDTTGGGGIDTTGSGDPDNLANNSWEFTANNHVFSGSIISAQNGPSISGSQLVLIGSMQSNSTDTTFGITVQLPNGTVDTGSYKTVDAGTNFSLQKTTTGDIIYAANATNTDQVITIHITSYDAATKVVAGNFSGDSYDFGGNDVPIPSGVFKATIQ